MAYVEWRLGAVLAEHGITPYRLEREMERLGYAFGRNNVYRLTRGDGPKRIDRDTLAALVHALRSLSGADLTAGDLFWWHQ